MPSVFVECILEDPFTKLFLTRPSMTVMLMRPIGRVARRLWSKLKKHPKQQQQAKTPTNITTIPLSHMEPIESTKPVSKPPALPPRPLELISLRSLFKEEPTQYVFLGDLFHEELLISLADLFREHKYFEDDDELQRLRAQWSLPQVPKELRLRRLQLFGEEDELGRFKVEITGRWDTSLDLSVFRRHL